MNKANYWIYFSQIKKYALLTRKHINILGDLFLKKYRNFKVILSQSGGLRQSVCLMLLTEFIFVQSEIYSEFVEVVCWTLDVNFKLCSDGFNTNKEVDLTFLLP